MSLAITSFLRSGSGLLKTASRQAFKRYTTQPHYIAAILDNSEEKLHVREVERPKLRNEEIRIQVSYCSVNIADVERFTEKHETKKFIPGYEFTGEILEVGRNVPKDVYSIGMRVAALNLKKFGGLAEECVVDMQDVWAVSGDLSLKDAAVILYGHSLAFYTFGRLSQLEETHNVLVGAGSAGLGLAAVDVAANIYKTRVIAVTEEETNSEVMRNYGAFETLHYKPNLRDAVIGLLENDGADVVYDTLGGDMHSEIANCVRKGGRIFHANPKIPKTLPIPPAHASLTVVDFLKLKEKNLEEYRQIVQDTLEMAEEGVISAHITNTYRLQEVNKAVEFIKSKQCTGKILVATLEH